MLIKITDMTTDFFSKCLMSLSVYEYGKESNKHQSRQCLCRLSYRRSCVTQIGGT